MCECPDFGIPKVAPTEYMDAAALRKIAQSGMTPSEINAYFKELSNQVRDWSKTQRK